MRDEKTEKNIVWKVEKETGFCLFCKWKISKSVDFSVRLIIMIRWWESTYRWRLQRITYIKAEKKSATPLTTAATTTKSMWPFDSCVRLYLFLCLYNYKLESCIFSIHKLIRSKLTNRNEKTSVREKRWCVACEYIRSSPPPAALPFR